MMEKNLYMLPCTCESGYCLAHNINLIEEWKGEEVKIKKEKIEKID